MHWGNFGYGMGFGGGFMILIWIAVLAAIAYAVVYAIRNKSTNGPSTRNCIQDSAIEIAAKRYASGEISKDEYIDIIEGLKKS